MYVCMRMFMCFMCVCMYVCMYCVCVCVKRVCVCAFSMYVQSNHDKQCEILYNFAKLAKTFEYAKWVFMCLCVLCGVHKRTDVLMRRHTCE